MKTSELLKLLKKNGCKFVKNGSNHDLWYSPITGKDIWIPRHKSQEVPKGTANAILKDEGLK